MYPLGTEIRAHSAFVNWVASRLSFRKTLIISLVAGVSFFLWMVSAGSPVDVAVLFAALFGAPYVFLYYALIHRLQDTIVRFIFVVLLGTFLFALFVLPFAMQLIAGDRIAQCAASRQVFVRPSEECRFFLRYGTPVWQSF